MNKSFEDKIKESLAGYRAEPPAGAREAILGEPSAAWAWTNIYHVIGGVLLLLAFFMTGYQPELERDAEVNIADQIPLENKRTTPNQREQLPTSTITEQSEATLSPAIDIGNNEPVTQTDNPSNSSSIVYFKQEETTPEAISDFVPNHELFDVQALPKDLDYVSGDRNILFLEVQKRKKRIVPEQKAFFNPYIDAGAFFLYNRLQPNLNDDIYVGDYDAPFGISAARIGASVSLGLQHDWNDQFNTRLGLVLNNYNQQFSFTVRNTTPDSVALQADLITPIFEEEHVQIRKRVSTVGLRFQNTFAFPSRYNALFFTAEYHRRVGVGAVFNYNGESYSLSSPNQWMLELGLRKQLASLSRGELYIIPGIRYSISKFGQGHVLSVKPFSVGVSLSYTLK